MPDVPCATLSSVRNYVCLVLCLFLRFLSDYETIHILPSVLRTSFIREHFLVYLDFSYPSAFPCSLFFGLMCTAVSIVLNLKLLHLPSLPVPVAARSKS